MIIEFENYIKKNQLFNESDKIIIALSGGIDSMCMLDLFTKSNYKNISIAHCNFKLRGEESDADYNFVKNYCIDNNLDFHTISFDTKLYSEKKKISIQMAARELRYNWFENRRQELNANYIAIAHNSDDVIETFLINLFSRNTGIKGIRGIKNKTKYIVRPLLFANRNSINDYVEKNKIKFRYDSSNSEDYYLRNNIRHNIIPMLKSNFNNFSTNILENIENFKEVEEVYNLQIENIKNQLISKNNEKVFINISVLQTLKSIKTILFEILKDFDFNSKSIDDIISTLSSNSGKIFHSDSHTLLRDRDFLIISKSIEKSIEFVKIFVDSSIINSHINLIINQILIDESFNLEKNNLNIAQLDFDKLFFPLIIRKWENGDFFFPLGMKNKKKVSDFLIDNKISQFDKNETLIIEDNKQRIVWIVGQRIDDRFKITEDTKKVFQMQLK